MMSLWAPRAQSVEIEIEPTGSQPMARDDDGWWRADVRPEGRYRYVVDGFAMADPCSHWQPDGVDGWSRVVDHAAFDWHDHAWVTPSFAGVVLYELHIGTFSAPGTFDGAIEHLDHLVDLGVRAIEVMPVAEFGGTRGWGYDGVLLFAPHHSYGGPEGFKRLVDACHRRQIAVVLDVVYNHFGPHGNHLARCGPYFSDEHETRWGAAVNLDGPGSDGVREFFCANAEMWVRHYHVDGLRVDAIHSFVDRSARSLLEQLTTHVHGLADELGRQVWMIAESDLNDPRVVRTVDEHGLGFDASWSDDFHHALHAVVTGEHVGYYCDFGALDQLARAVRQSYVYDGRYSPHRQRTHGRSPRGLPPSRFLAYAQTHDQIGNRAQGERLGALVSQRLLEVAAAVVVLSPFVPMLFQGEEWGASSPFLYFTDQRDPALGAAVRDGRRNEFASFGWNPDCIPDPQAFASFERSKLDWSELHRPPNAALLAWYRSLIALRTTEFANQGLVAHDVQADEDRRCLVVQTSRLTWAANFSAAAHYVVAPVSGEEAVALSNDASANALPGQIYLPPENVVVFRSS